MRLLLAGLVLILSTSVLADTYVKGYYKQNGTYVEPHYRSSPNGTTTDNFSTKGNVNPYTGQEGTRNPEPYNQYRAPSLKSPDLEPLKPYGN